MRRELLAGARGAEGQSRRRSARIAFARALYDGHRFGLPAEGAPEAVQQLARRRRARSTRASSRPATRSSSPPATCASTTCWRAPRPPSATGRAAPRPSCCRRRRARRRAARQVVVVDRPDLAQAQIVIGHEGMARTDPERMAAIAHERDPGRRRASRRGSCRGCAPTPDSPTASTRRSRMRRAPGPFLVSTSTRVAEARRTIDLVLAELERAQSGGLQRRGARAARPAPRDGQLRARPRDLERRHRGPRRARRPGPPRRLPRHLP